MAVSDFTDEVQLKVYRGHVRIPVFLLVPLAMVASLYCLLYFYANSNWFADDLPELLNGAFPGSFQVRELVVEPSLTDYRIVGAQIRTSPDSEPIITAPEVRATLAPSHLFVGRIEVTDGLAKGADVRLAFDENNHMNLLKALGIQPHDEEVDPTEGERALQKLSAELQEEIREPILNALTDEDDGENLWANGIGFAVVLAVIEILDKRPDLVVQAVSALSRNSTTGKAPLSSPTSGEGGQEGSNSGQGGGARSSD